MTPLLLSMDQIEMTQSRAVRVISNLGGREGGGVTSERKAFGLELLHDR